MVIYFIWYGHVTTTWPVFPLISYSALHASTLLNIWLPTMTWWQEFPLQCAMHLEILSNRYVSRLIADGVLSSEMLKCLVRD